jgi:WD40 repeat protein
MVNYKKAEVADQDRQRWNLFRLALAAWLVLSASSGPRSFSQEIESRLTIRVDMPHLNFHAALSPDGKVLAYTDGVWGVKLLDLAKRKERMTIDLRHVRRICSIAFSPDSKTLAVGTKQGRVRLVDVGTDKELTLLESEGGNVCQLTFAPDGKTLALANRTCEAILWDLEKT